MEKRDKAWAILVLIDYAVQTHFDKDMFFQKLRQISESEGIKFSTEDIGAFEDLFHRMATMIRRDEKGVNSF